MRTVLFALPTMLVAVMANAENLVPPEVVRLENIQVEGDVRTVYMSNANKHYVLFCNVKADGCITPEENKNYLLFDSSTRWKMPGAKDFLTLRVMQDWTVTYKKGKNVGLIAEDAGTGPGIGMFILDETEGGYEQDTIISDGPIIYGTGLSEEDRAKAWKRFFLQMVEAVIRQQGQEALHVKLARRCISSDVCTIGLDADFVGIGGIREPRKVLVVVATDIHDKNKQLSRTVCTYPAKGTIVCRDWDTGKLVSAKHPPLE